MTWIGPSPDAIEALGDKVQARTSPKRSAPRSFPARADPVESAEEILEFAEGSSASRGHQGRLRRRRPRHQGRPHLRRNPRALRIRRPRGGHRAFGRGECFIEKFLDKPRHVETQCLADAHGNVVVVSTRDCSLQRRNQKLVEEAPAPFLTEEQNRRLYESSKAILKEAGYLGAGTCEFLVGQDGTISFLEVNTRLQVEHCVSEEVTGIDLVREQFRIAARRRSSATTTPRSAATPSSSASPAKTRAATSCPPRHPPRPEEPHGPRRPHRLRRTSRATSSAATSTPCSPS
jgi:acetyl-CoA/propionyl-CoA carboxylase biotin carboxyl carrier protein